MRRLGTALVLIVTGALSTAGAYADDVWRLDITMQAPRKLEVPIPGVGKRTVWYMTYRVVNRTDKPQRFYPKFTLMTDTQQSYDDTVLPSARDAIAEHCGSDRFLLDSVKMSRNPIPPSGEADSPKALHGFACWVGVDPKAEQYTLLVSGLTNAYVRVADPRTKKESVRRKMLQAVFVTPPGEDRVELTGELSWIYR